MSAKPFPLRRMKAARDGAPDLDAHRAIFASRKTIRAAPPAIVQAYRDQRLLAVLEIADRRRLRQPGRRGAR